MQGDSSRGPVRGEIGAGDADGREAGTGSPRNVIGPPSAGRLKKRTGKTMRAERQRLGAREGKGIHRRDWK